MAAVLKMDSSSSRQRSSPVNDQQNPTHGQLNQLNHHHHHVQHQQPPYTFPLQQQPPGAWTPYITAAPFYPAFAGQPFQQAYFDPATQLAYHQMMFNPQHAFPQMPPPQRTGSTSSDYFAQAHFSPFPSGTPPPHAQRPLPTDGPGFHPYRRPNRQHSSENHPHIPQPPYARPDASGSSSSVSSSNSGRPRTNSNQSGHSGHNVPSPNSISRSRNNGSPNPSPPTTKSTPQRLPHNRNGSASSSSTSASSRPSILSTTSTSSSSTATTTNAHRLARPSPLSQGSTFTPSEKRMSRDDSDLAAMLESTSKSSSGIGRSSGLKGRLRRALSFNALKEEEDNNNDNDNDGNDDDDDESIKASTYKPKPTISSSVVHPETAGGIRSPDSALDDAESTATIQTKKKSRAASLFNSRLNASTDNISLSSTVSSASVMIRKLGSMSKLVVRRNSLAGITSIFKDKNKDTDKAKKKDKKSAKAGAVQAEVSHVHAELDRSIGADANGLSPAAELARQHTLKTKAEAAAKAKAQQEAQAAANAITASAANGTVANGAAGVSTWDKNTTTRAGPTSPVKRSGGIKVNEDGTRVVVEDEDEESDDGHYDPVANSSYNMDGWDDDDDWDVPEDEDATIRMDMSKARISEETEEVEPWAADVRRSIERTKRPKRGILKNAGSYDQSQYLNDQTIPARTRSNSYNSHPGQTPELGPLARIPSPDPDHIDGLHRHNSHSSGHSNSTAPTIPPLKFDTSSPIRSEFTTDTSLPSSSERPPSIFQHPALNSSAPALSMVPSSAPTLTHRSATVPAKKLAFATSLSVYDTFSATVYDRRSEPATWSRLTPALAQRIKEELNSYKMEEMEVHAASRIHTQFFV